MGYLGGNDRYHLCQKTTNFTLWGGTPGRFLLYYFTQIAFPFNYKGFHRFTQNAKKNSPPFF